MTILAEKLDQIMAELRRIPDVPAVIITRRDGTVIASNIPRKTDLKKVASMVAAIVGTSDMAAGELEQGGFLEVTVETQEGRVLGVGAGENAILVAMAGKDANVGLILLTLKRHAAEVARLLGSEGQEAERVAVEEGVPQ